MDRESQIIDLNIDDILPNRFQPRIKFNDQAINELADSIKEHGVIQPIVVRRIGDKYEIIAGERRYKASTMAGKTTIPAIVTTLDDKNSAEVALIENVQRQDLTPIEEAISYKKILDMGYISQGALGEKLGKKQSTIANKLRLLNLNEEVQEALMENKISERHARSLLKLNDKNQVLMLNRIINERLTVRKTDEEIDKLIKEDGSEDQGEQKIIKEEKGENVMNNEILKEFNIPTEPIVDTSNDEIIGEDMSQVEDTKPVESVTPIVEPVSTEMPEPVNIESTDVKLNPGFVDVDKIENEAKDIITEVKPANMDELLKPDENIINKMEEVQQPLPEEPIFNQPARGGKFFNMFDFNQENKNPNFVENVEEKQVNMDFGEPKYSANTNIFGTDVMTNNDQVVNQESLNPEPAPIVAEPLREEVQENVMEPITFKNSEPESLEQTTDEYTEDDFRPLPVKPVEDSITFANPVNTFALNDDAIFTNGIDNTPERPYMMDNNVKFDEEGEIEVEVPSNEPVVQVDMKTIISLIRNCSNQIEKYGYKIETEEIDLPDTYEVTFKINK